jgi:hypothetical protein
LRNTSTTTKLLPLPKKPHQLRNLRRISITTETTATKPLQKQSTNQRTNPSTIPATQITCSPWSKAITTRPSPASIQVST